MFPAHDLLIGAEMAYRRERAAPVSRRRAQRSARARRPLRVRPFTRTVRNAPA
jgi:hypothetical protein